MSVFRSLTLTTLGALAIVAANLTLPTPANAQSYSGINCNIPLVLCT